MKIKIRQIQSQIQNWLENAGFEQGLRDRDLIAPAAVAGVLLLAGLWLGGGAGERRRAALGRIRAVEAGAQSVERYRNLADRWAEIQKETMAPAAKDSAEWIQVRISSYAKSENMEIVSFSPGASQTLGGLKWQRGTFQMRGSYHEIGRFLAQLESSKPFLGLSNLTLSRDGSHGGGDNGNGIGVVAQMEVFAFTEAAPGGT